MEGEEKERDEEEERKHCRVGNGSKRGGREEGKAEIALGWGRNNEYRTHTAYHQVCKASPGCYDP